MARHSDAVSIHKGAYVGATDPSLDPDNLVAPEKLWVDTSSGPPYVLKMRNAGDTAWEAVGIAGVGTIAHSSLTGLTAGDDHTQYQKESEKGAASGYAGLNGSSVVPIAQLGTGSPTGTKFLRDDNTLAIPPGSGGDVVNPMTTPADLIVGGTSGAPARLAKGSDGQVLTVDPTTHLLVWSTPAAGFSDPETTAGDMIMHNAANAIARLPIGTLAQTLRARGGTLIPTWEDTFAVISCVIDGASAVISTGIKFDIEVPFACVITRADLLADQSGSCVVDLYKCTYAQYDGGSTHPVIGDKITASAPPTLSTAVKSSDATLTGWTTTIAADDVIRVVVNSATTVTRVTLSLKVRRT